MPWTSAFFTSLPARKATSARMSEALMAPCPPRPATTTFTTGLGILRLHAGGARVGGPLVLADVGGGEDARPPGDDDGELAAPEPVDEELVEPGRIRDRVDH